MPIPTTQANMTGRTISLFHNANSTMIHITPPANRKIQNFVTTLIYAALSILRSDASHAATKSETSDSLCVTPAAMAGVTRSVR